MKHSPKHRNPGDKETEVSEVPTTFHRSLEGIPFDDCRVCSRLFPKLGIPYAINKQFKDGKLVSENAICQSCRDEKRASLSKESYATVMAFVESISERKVDAESDSLERCACCYKSKDELNDYTLLAVVEEEQLQAERPPILICDDCLDDIPLSKDSSTQLFEDSRGMAIFTSEDQSEETIRQLKLELL